MTGGDGAEREIDGKGSQSVGESQKGDEKSQGLASQRGVGSSWPVRGGP